MNMNRYIAAFLALVLVGSVGDAQKIYQWTDENGQKQYSQRPPPEGVEAETRVLEHGKRVALVPDGSVVARVPDGWVAGSLQTPIPEASTLRLTPSDGSDGVMLVSVITPTRAADLPSADEVRLIAEVGAAKAQASSEEAQLNAEAFEFGQVRGYWFSASDRAPPPGEYKYMTQATGRVGDRVITLTALGQQSKAATEDAAQALLAGIR